MTHIKVTIPDILQGFPTCVFPSACQIPALLHVSGLNKNLVMDKKTLIMTLYGYYIVFIFTLITVAACSSSSAVSPVPCLVRRSVKREPTEF